jgi:hypothetical protein
MPRRRVVEALTGNGVILRSAPKAVPSHSLHVIGGFLEWDEIWQNRGIPESAGI